MAELGWIMFALAAVVCLVVFTALFMGLRSAGRRSPADDPGGGTPDNDDGGDRVVVLAGMVLPAAIIAFTLGYTIYTLRSVAGIGGPGGTTGPAAHSDHSGQRVAHQGAVPGQVTAPIDALEVRITGHQWWWEIGYPDMQVDTANEVHIPAGVPISLIVTSDDVIHSFWVPQVAGKVDVIPGRTNTMTIQVDAPGVYRGMCSEFCGLQHARMHLFLVAMPPAEFDAWIAQQRTPPAPATDPLVQQGQAVFQRACAECHAVRGTAAGGTFGPDLTHVASRQTLGAGTHENTPVNLRGWVTDPQGMKVGNTMPRPNLSEPDLQAVLAYLETLK